jgi:hypothetical protein
MLPILLPKEKISRKYQYLKPSALVPQFFSGRVPIHYEIALTKNKDKTNSYLCELLVENTSEFLVFVNRFNLYTVQDTPRPLLTLENLHENPLEPKFTFAKTDEIMSSDNPPHIMIEMDYSVQLFYEYLHQTQKTEQLESKSESPLIQFQMELQTLEHQMNEIQIRMEIIRSKIREIKDSELDLKESNMKKSDSKSLKASVGKKKTKE